MAEPPGSFASGISNFSLSFYQTHSQACHCEEGQRPDVAISWYDLTITSAPKSIECSNCSMACCFSAHLTASQEIATSAPSGPPRNDAVIWQLAASIQQNDKL